MINLFFEGGILFMSLISFFLIMTAVSFYTHSEKLKTYTSIIILTSFSAIYFFEGYLVSKIYLQL